MSSRERVLLFSNQPSHFWPYYMNNIKWFAKVKLIHQIFFLIFFTHFLSKWDLFILISGKGVLKLQNGKSKKHAL